ncbi:MAG: hypothetical protein UY56_C0018G0009 [Parcubacteria group bacterium GW2011_GWA1_50_14]|nr:MAG: hypothetical protein UY56_C0018G0009 [Parcubacteria group bacterium GW2011_GWA1_50_14]
MENTDITFEKRIKVAIRVFIVVYLLLIYNLAGLMSVLPTFLEEKIAHAPTGDPTAILNLMDLLNYKYSE